MTITLDAGFAPTYKLQKPDETDAAELKLSLAKWDCSANVTISNEPGRRFKVGFVQVLYENEMVATYEKSKLVVTCDPLPVLDSDTGMYPWYDNSIADSPELLGTDGEVKVTATMDDEPDDPFDWERVPGDPLIELSYRLKFHTWLCVRDITTNPYPESFEKVLCQFSYVIEASFKVDTSKPQGRRCTFATGTQSANRPEMVTPPRPINACIWKDVVANDQLSDIWSDRLVVRSGHPPVQNVTTNVSVKDIAKRFGG